MTRFFLSLILFLTLSAHAVAQPANPRVQLPLGRVTAGHIIDAIERQTHYRVTANLSKLAGRSVTITEVQTPLFTLLDHLLDGSDMEYRIEGNSLLLPVPQVHTLEKAVVEQPVAPPTRETLFLPSPSTGEPNPFLPTVGSVREPFAKLPRQPRFALKTNLVYDAMATLSLGAEIRAGKAWTVDLPFSYNPWQFSRDRRLAHFQFQPEARYWIYEPFNGHFLGTNLQYAAFSIGGWDMPEAIQQMFGVPQTLDRLYEGYAAGAGVSYGYHWMLSPVISLEATAGFGYARMWGTKYRCEVCGERLGTFSKHYFGLTKLGLSLVFIIK